MAPAAMIAAVLLSAPRARAAGAADEAAAATLFQDAKQLVKAGDYEHACPKFAEAHRLFPTATKLLNLGDCYEHVDMLASAWGSFRSAEIAARAAGDAERQAEAARRADALAPRLAKLAVVVPPAVNVPGFELKRDGALVGEGQWGISLPVDVGHHEIVASAPGYRRWSTMVRIDADGSAASVAVPPLEKVAAPPSAAVSTTSWSTQRTVGMVLGGLGLVGLGVGSAFTVKMAGKNSDSLPHCQPSDVTKCDATGVDLRNQAFDAAHIATGTFIGGAALLASGIVVFLTAPSTAPKKPEAALSRLVVGPIAAPGVGGALLQGAW